MNELNELNKKEDKTELDDDELEGVAGGKAPDKWVYEGNEVYHAICANCGDIMRYSYTTTGFLKRNDHYVCNSCGRDIWRSFLNTTGVTKEHR